MDETSDVSGLIGRIIEDLADDAKMAHVCLKSARSHVRAGRVDAALALVLEAEPKLYDARKRINLATYAARTQRGVG